MTEGQKHRNLFDKFAASTGALVARAPFFSFCVILIVVWFPTIAWFTIDTWQLIINTITTIITFLLVALLQNTQDRSTAAINHKLDAIADAQVILLRGNRTKAATDAVSRLKTMRGVELEASKKPRSYRGK